MKIVGFHHAGIVVPDLDQAQEFYFVLNGSVNVYISQAAPTGEIRQQLAGIMREGTSFGEMELIITSSVIIRI